MENLRKYIYNKRFTFGNKQNIEIEISSLTLKYNSYLLVLNHDANTNYTLVGILFGSLIENGNILFVLNKGNRTNVTQGMKNIPLKITVDTNQIALSLTPLHGIGTSIDIKAKGV